jgi:DNA-3-methyladenine glycosylase II
MDSKIVEHFKKNDPLLYSYIEKIEEITWRSEGNYFEDLCDHIISQQLSEKAGETIFRRFKKLFPSGKITAGKVLAIPDEKIREAGCSWAKIKSLKDLAQKVQDKIVDLEKLDTFSNEKVITELVQVRGIGPWTAEMFLMFSLKRDDVFSHGDLGLRNAIQRIYGFKDKPTVKQVEKIIKKWTPYKTYACRILWKSLMLKD